jgi:hypothetical protein
MRLFAYDAFGRLSFERRRMIRFVTLPTVPPPTRLPEIPVTGMTPAVDFVRKTSSASKSSFLDAG